MRTICLWDNSWHVVDCAPNDSRRDQYERKPKPLELKNNDSNLLRSLSSATIGELMNSEDGHVIVLPNSFGEGNEELKDQYIFRVTEKDGQNIDSITTGNIVGFIGEGKEKGGLNIHIHSRFSLNDEDGKGKDFFLYYMLEKVMAINTFSYSSSSGFTDIQVFDFLLFFFPKLLKEALSLGMYKEYVHHEYNDANIRGAVDVNRHIHLNIPANGKIAYRTREFSYDNAVTQLIRHTIECIRRKPFGKAILHNDPDTEGYVQQIILATPTFHVQKRQAIINENLRPVNHPYYTKYTALQNLCLRILRYEKLSYGEAGDKVYGIIIDAAWLWEEYLACVFTKTTGLKHYTRNSDYHLLVNSKTGDAFQKIIPDYLDEDKKLVADAKYMPLIKDELSADKAAPVYYKTIMYMYRFNAKQGFLFHPVSRKKENEINDTIEIVASENESITFSKYYIEDRTDCQLYKLGLVVNEDSVDNDSTDNKEKTKKQKKIHDSNSWMSYRDIMSKRETEFVSKILDVTNKANPCGLK